MTLATIRARHAILALTLVPFATARAQGNLWTDWSVPQPLAPYTGADDFRFDAQGRIALRAYLDSAYQAHDFYVAMLEPDGGHAWTYHYQPPTLFNENVTHLAVDSQGAVIAVGFTRQTQLAGERLVIIKLSPQGSVLWTQTFPPDSQGFPEGLLVDSEDHVLVLDEGGRLRKLDPGGQLEWLAPIGANEAARLALRDDDSLVVYQWRWQDVARAVAVDPGGAVLWSTDLSLEFIPWEAHAGPSGESLVAGAVWGGGPFEAHRLEADGSLTWSTTYVPATYTFTGTRAMFRPNGDLVVAGSLREGVIVYRSWRVFEIAAADGQVTWEASHAESLSNNRINDAVLDSAGNLYVSGRVDEGAEDLRFARFSPSGQLEWIEEAYYSRLRLDPKGALVGLEGDDVVRLLPRVGSEFCAAVPNTTGVPGRLAAYGSEALDENGLQLVSSDLPPGQFGISLVSPITTSLPMYAGVGTLCLAPFATGRFGVGMASPGGIWIQDVDLTALPSPQGFVMAMVGETWNFQHWHRDGGTTNLTTATQILVR